MTSPTSLPATTSRPRRRLSKLQILTNDEFQGNGGVALVDGLRMCISIRRIVGTTYSLFSVSFSWSQRISCGMRAGLAFVFKDMEMEKSRHTHDCFHWTY